MNRNTQDVQKLCEVRDFISDLIGESINPILNRNYEAVKKALTDKILDLNNKPQEGKIYALTGKPQDKCIANGNSWAESGVL